MKKVLVTGADGFLGKRIIGKLVLEGKEVYATVYPGNEDAISFPAEEFHIVPLDLNGIKEHIHLFPDGIDTMYHLAWGGVSAEQRNDFLLQEANIRMTLQCLLAAKDLGIRRLIVPGSTNEYLYYGKPINYLALPSPGNAYGASKVAARYLCDAFAQNNDMEFLYAIITGIYAPDRRDGNVIFYTIDRLLHGEKPSLTKLEQLWDYVHIEDVAEALFLIGEKGRNGEVYAIGHGDNWPLSRYIEIIHREIDETLPLGIGEIPYGTDRLPGSRIDLTALERDTGFCPKISFEQGIKPIIEEMRLNMEKEHE